MRVLFVSHSFPPRGRPLSNIGGMQRVATELDSAFRGHDGLTYSSMVLRSSWRWTHVKTFPFLAAALVRIRAMIQREDVDVVLFSSMVTASLAPFLNGVPEKHGVRMAAIVHGRDVTLEVRPYQHFVPRIFESLDAVLPVSRATSEACLERGLDPAKVYVVPNGVSTRRFDRTTSREAARAALFERFGDLSFPARGLLICSVGRQVRRKGFAWFVESVLPLLPADVHYWIAGDGPEEQRILDAAAARGVADRVRLLGRVSEEELATLYSAADLFAMPNIPVPGDMEGFGIVMLEAGLCGLPTIASRLEGITDVIEECENGHLVRSGDAWGFSEAIMRYYHEPGALRSARERATRYVEEHFSWTAVARQYADVIGQLSSSEPVAEDVLV